MIGPQQAHQKRSGSHDEDKVHKKKAIGSFQRDVVTSTNVRNKKSPPALPCTTSIIELLQLQPISAWHPCASFSPIEIHHTSYLDFVTKVSVKQLFCIRKVRQRSKRNAKLAHKHSPSKQTRGGQWEHRAILATSLYDNYFTVKRHLLSNLPVKRNISLCNVNSVKTKHQRQVDYTQLHAAWPDQGLKFFAHNVR